MRILYLSLLPGMRLDAPSVRTTHIRGVWRALDRRAVPRRRRLRAAAGIEAIRGRAGLMQVAGLEPAPAVGEPISAPFDGWPRRRARAPREGTPCASC